MSDVIDGVLNDLKHPVFDYNIVTIHSTSPDEAVILQEKFAQKTGYNFSYDPFEVALTIGSHIGPTALALAYIPKYSTLGNNE